MSRSILTIILSFVFTLSFGQELKISNGKREKAFPSSTVFKMIISAGENYEAQKCCNYQEIVGQIQSIGKDSIRMKLDEVWSQRNVEKFDYGEFLESPSGNIDFSFHRDSIRFLYGYRSLKAKNRKSIPEAIGGVLIVTGLVSGLNSLMVLDQESKNRLRISGAFEVGLGLLTIFLFQKKSYSFIHPSKPWKVIN
ncbi:MAG: hypothetical protein R8P61_04230 [Bacteroidia bacterium]|nr:hypothetical protein [Bacteroidia bacterium]